MASRYESDMTRKEKMQLEKEKLSKMNFKEKLAYIWEYSRLSFSASSLLSSSSARL